MDETGLALEDLDTPFLWVDLDQLEANIAHLAAFFREAGVGWRPHVKGVKVPAKIPFAGVRCVVSPNPLRSQVDQGD